MAAEEGTEKEAKDVETVVVKEDNEGDNESGPEEEEEK
jgi:hypothetical protein